MEVESSKYRKLWSLLSIIFIGTFGSGLWDVLIKDIVYGIGEIFFRLMTVAYSGYVDALYKKVGAQFDAFLYIPSIFIFTIIIFSPFFIYLLLRCLYRKIDRLNASKGNDTSSFDEKIFKIFVTKRKIVYAVAIGSFVILSLFYIDIFIKWYSTNAAVRYVEQSMEIIRPALSEEKYVEMRSKFRQIDNAEKTQAIISDIVSIADNNGHVLPESKLYGIVVSNKAN